MQMHILQHRGRFRLSPCTSCCLHILEVWELKSLVWAA